MEQFLILMLKIIIVALVLVLLGLLMYGTIISVKNVEFKKNIIKAQTRTKGPNKNGKSSKPTKPVGRSPYKR